MLMGPRQTISITQCIHCTSSCYPLMHIHHTHTHIFARSILLSIVILILQIFVCVMNMHQSQSKRICHSQAFSFSATRRSSESKWCKAEWSGSVLQFSIDFKSTREKQTVMEEGPNFYFLFHISQLWSVGWGELHWIRNGEKLSSLEHHQLYVWINYVRSVHNWSIHSDHLFKDSHHPPTINNQPNCLQQRKYNTITPLKIPIHY